MNAVICVLNSKYIHSSLAPWCLLAGVDKWCETGIEAEAVEGTINERPEAVMQRIVDKSPRVIGFCCYIWNITATKQLIKLVKDRLPESVIVLGGPEVSYNAGDVLAGEPLVDYIISGEGEKPFALLLNAVYRNQQPKNIPGLCQRKGGRSVVSAPNTPEEEPPSPYGKDYFEALKGRIAYLETSRGCPYSCAFCLSGRCGGVRFFDIGRAEREILLLANSGTQTVKLVDRTFNINRKRAAALFRFIIDNYGKTIPDGVCFHFEIAGDILDDETIGLLKTAPAGAVQLEIGLQSFYPKTLEHIDRKTDIQRLKANISSITQAGNIHVHIDLIAGLPYEDIDRFQDSFDAAYSLRPNMLQLGFLKLLHGSKMRDHPDIYPCRYGELPPYEVIDTPWMSAEEIRRLHRTEDALERLYNSGRFKRTLEYILGKSGMTPFALFFSFGQHCTVKVKENISLDDYTAVAYEYFCGLEGIDKTVLRDIMVCDRLSTNPSGRLPKALDVKDDLLKAALKELKKNPSTCPIKGVKRGAAVLYSEGCVVYADYEHKNPVTGEYQINKVSLKDNIIQKPVSRSYGFHT